MGRRDFLLAAEVCGALQVDRADGLADEALLISLGQIGRNFAGALTGLQLLGKELLRGLESVGLLSSLLIGDKVEIVVGFLLDGLALNGGIDLADKQIG